jgi:hypothetical protein
VFWGVLGGGGGGGGLSLGWCLIGTNYSPNKMFIDLSGNRSDSRNVLIYNWL